MQETNALQNWVSGLDRRAYGVLIGVLIGLIGGGIGLLMAAAGPIITFGAGVRPTGGTLYPIKCLGSALWRHIYHDAAAFRHTAI